MNKPILEGIEVPDVLPPIHYTDVSGEEYERLMKQWFDVSSKEHEKFMSELVVDRSEKNKVRKVNIM